MSICIIEDGYNTSYITSVIIGLYYGQSLGSFIGDSLSLSLPMSQSLLDSDITDSKLIYLQELIKNDIITKLKKKCSINSKIINEIRNIIFRDKIFDCDKSLDLCDSYLKLYPPSTLYNYFVESFGYQKIEYTGDIAESFLTFCPKESSTSIRHLLDDFFIKSNRSLNNIPQNIAINIVGDNASSIIEIDIQKRIKIPHKNKEHDLKWDISSVICYDSGTYFTYVYSLSEKCWYQYRSIHTTLESNFKTIEIAKHQDIIKKTCVFIIYKFA